MSSASDYLEVQLGNHLLRTPTFAKPSALWLALFIVKPGDDGTGGTEVSTSGTAYGRVACGPGNASWSEPTVSGEFINLVDFLYEEPTDDWGEITAFGIYTAETGGELLLANDLLVDQNVLDGGLAPKFAAGDLKITFS